MVGNGPVGPTNLKSLDKRKKKQGMKIISLVVA